MKTKTKPPSRQLLARRALVAAGKCPGCREETDTGNLCPRCLNKQRKRMRKRGGFGKWKPGGRGRPPLACK